MGFLFVGNFPSHNTKRQPCLSAHRLLCNDLCLLYTYIAYSSNTFLFCAIFRELYLLTFRIMVV